MPEKGFLEEFDRPAIGKPSQLRSGGAQVHETV